jgi:limonene-1,2-epoxide hydrolase
LSITVSIIVHPLRNGLATTYRPPPTPPGVGIRYVFPGDRSIDASGGISAVPSPGCGQGAAVAGQTNKELVQSFWETLYARDWDGIASYFTDTSEYTDVPSPADDLAVGPDLIVARLRLGLERISGYEHELKLMVAEGDTVITEHAETWHWHTGEQVTVPFVSVHELRDGKIMRWWDYWDLTTLMNAAPDWWIEHVAQGYT